MENKSSSEERRRTPLERLDEVCGITAEMAHSLKNMFAIILADLHLAEQIIKQKTKNEQDFQQMLYKAIDEASTTVRKADETIKTTLCRIRGESLEKKSYDICSLMRSVLKEDAVFNTVFVQKNVPSEKVFISGHELSMRDAIINLLLNARVAIEKDRLNTKGMTKQYFISVSVVVKKDENEKEFVQISVRDNGIGISPDNINKIFDHYFTTNKSGGGTGLGLAVVNKTVKDHNGTIGVISKEGLGTCFSIDVPVERTIVS